MIGIVLFLLLLLAGVGVAAHFFWKRLAVGGSVPQTQTVLLLWGVPRRALGPGEHHLLLCGESIRVVNTARHLIEFGPFGVRLGNGRKVEFAGTLQISIRPPLAHIAASIIPSHMDLSGYPGDELRDWLIGHLKKAVTDVAKVKRSMTEARQPDFATTVETGLQRELSGAVSVNINFGYVTSLS